MLHSLLVRLRVLRLCGVARISRKVDPLAKRRCILSRKASVEALLDDLLRGVLICAVEQPDTLITRL